MVGVQYMVADLAVVILPRDPHWTRHPPVLLGQSFCTCGLKENKYIHIYTCVYLHVHVAKSRDLLLLGDIRSFPSIKTCPRHHNGREIVKPKLSWFYYSSLKKTFWTDNLLLLWSEKRFSFPTAAHQKCSKNRGKNGLQCTEEKYCPQT